MAPKEGKTKKEPKWRPCGVTGKREPYFVRGWDEKNGRASRPPKKSQKSWKKTKKLWKTCSQTLFWRWELSLNIAHPKCWQDCGKLSRKKIDVITLRGFEKKIRWNEFDLGVSFEKKLGFPRWFKLFLKNLNIWWEALKTSLFAAFLFNLPKTANEIRNLRLNFSTAVNLKGEASCLKINDSITDQ